MKTNMKHAELLDLLSLGEDSTRQFKKDITNPDSLHADETPVSGAVITDLDFDYFRDFFQRRFGKNLDDEKISCY
jgi:predicted HTH transcriptional regulator